jgi:signal peptidase I
LYHFILAKTKKNAILDSRIMKSFLLFLLEVFKIVVIALLIVIPIRYFVFQPFLVKGESMLPNFHEGDYLIADQLSYLVRDPQRGEVIILRNSSASSQRYIKRIIGLPGERIEIKQGNITIYREEEKEILEESGYLALSVFTPGTFNIELSESQYFVMGDNRPFSVDSRRWGPIEEKDIIGRVLLRAWPLTDLAKFKAPAY